MTGDILNWHEPRKLDKKLSGFMLIAWFWLRFVTEGPRCLCGSSLLQGHLRSHLSLCEGRASTRYSGETSERAILLYVERYGHLSAFRCVIVYLRADMVALCCVCGLSLRAQVLPTQPVTGGILSRVSLFFCCAALSLWANRRIFKEELCHFLLDLWHGSIDFQVILPFSATAVAFCCPKLSQLF